MKIITFLFVILLVINSKVINRQGSFTMPNSYKDNFKVISPPSSLYQTTAFNFATKPNSNGDEGIQPNLSSVVQITKPTKIYRVYSSDKENSKIGGWWTFEEPKGTKDNYRKTYGNCPEWNDLERVVVCTLLEGSFVAMGTRKGCD